MRHKASEHLRPKSPPESPSSGPAFYLATCLRLLPSWPNATPAEEKRVLPGRRAPAKFHPRSSRTPKTREPERRACHHCVYGVLPRGRVFEVARPYLRNSAPFPSSPEISGGRKRYSLWLAGRRD